jgi:hypothetical protein
MTDVLIDQNFKKLYSLPRDKNGSSTMRYTTGDYGTSELLNPLADGLRIFQSPPYGTAKYGYVDAKNKVVIAAKFEQVRSFSDGMAAVQITVNGVKKWGFIDKKGKMVIQPTYNLEPGRFSEGVAPVRIGQDEDNYEMNYIDKTGKRLMANNASWKLGVSDWLSKVFTYGYGEFHGGFAWFEEGYNKFFVIDSEFNVVMQDLYNDSDLHGITMVSRDLTIEGKTFNKYVLMGGKIFAPDGTLLITINDAKGDIARPQFPPTNGNLMFVQVNMFGENERLGSNEVTMPCFINMKGEIVYYFVGGFEGFEGTVPKLRKK